MRDNITISEIAKLANVSKTTVSRVLNNKPDVQPETREKIEKIISKYDYHPNVFAKAISNQRSKTIGLLIPYYANYIFSNPFYYEIIRGITLEANKTGYYLMFLYSEEDNYIIALKQKRVDGVIVVSPGRDHKNIFDVIRDLDTPVVATSKIPGVENVSFIETNNVHGASLAVEHLISLGHRKIGFINGPESLASSCERLEGYRSTLKKHGIHFNKKLVMTGDTSISSGYKAMTALMAHKDLTAVFVASDLMAVGVVSAINEAGKSVPKDISVVGFDDIPLAGALNPPLTTVRQFAFEKGEYSARILIDLLEGRSIEEKPQLEVELVVRSSTKNVKL